MEVYGIQHIAAQHNPSDKLPKHLIDTSSVALERLANARSYTNTLLNVTEVQPVDSESRFADIDGDALDELQWQCIDNDLTLRVQSH